MQKEMNAERSELRSSTTTAALRRESHRTVEFKPVENHHVVLLNWKSSLEVNKKTHAALEGDAWV
jgi:hypothetical protein